ncbi:MAG: GNAT family N-acetyltransferase [Proteobacteria bacterium]|nr:GNAT family N-acetyltransferase [Pseudomonadota bacterium]
MSPDEFPIRPATPEDIEAITTIVEAAYTPYISRIGRAPGPMLDNYEALIARHLVHVLEAQGQVAGLLVLVREQDVLLLDNIAVSPAHQHRGFGRRLMTFLEEKAREMGVNAIKLYTNEAMTENITLYEKLGYKEIYRATENNFRRVYMQKGI